jgi:hypothetical protein
MLAFSRNVIVPGRKSAQKLTSSGIGKLLS